jgi:undecaprenyl-diphosphatase
VDDLVRAVVLGIVQGLTEFIPVSSSGHLILVPALFKWPDQGLAFDAGLHVGTLGALLLYFHRDWLRMAASGVRDTRQLRFALRSYSDESRLLWLLAVGTIPAAIVGLLFDDWIEGHVREAWLVAITLVVGGLVMFVSDRAGSHSRSLQSVHAIDAVVVGIAQAFALIPGLSRSGMTISAALWRGFERPDAARFAFLLGTPAFAGAAILKAPDLAVGSGADIVELAVGVLASFVVGLGAIRYLLLWLQRGGLGPFVVYRFGVAAATLGVAAMRTL